MNEPAQLALFVELPVQFAPARLRDFDRAPRRRFIFEPPLLPGLEVQVSPRLLARLLARCRRSVRRRRGFAECCLIWTGALGDSGSPVCRSGTDIFLVHRCVYQFAHGHVPSSVPVCQRCSDPRCCELSHLDCVVQFDG